MLENENIIKIFQSLIIEIIRLIIQVHQIIIYII